MLQITISKEKPYVANFPTIFPAQKQALASIHIVHEDFAPLKGTTVLWFIFDTILSSTKASFPLITLLFSSSNRSAKI